MVVNGRAVGIEAAALTAKVLPTEVPPPGCGLRIVTWFDPMVVTSEAGIAAVNVVLFTKVVVRATPFH